MSLSGKAIGSDVVRAKYVCHSVIQGPCGAMVRDHLLMMTKCFCTHITLFGHGMLYIASLHLGTYIPVRWHRADALVCAGVVRPHF